MIKEIKLIKFAFTELLLSIDVSSGRGKIAFEIIESCKTKEF